MMINEFFRLVFFRIPRLIVIFLFRIFGISFYQFVHALGFSVQKKLEKKILFNTVEFNHPQSHQLLGLAKSLKSRGCDVQILRCTGLLPRCEIKSSRNKLVPCMECKIFSRVLPYFFGLETVDLKQIDADQSQPYQYKDEHVQNACHDSIVRYYYGAPPNEDSDEYRSIMAEEVKTFALSSRLFKAAVDAFRPDCVVANMNVYSVWAPHFHFCQQKKIPYKMISQTAYNKRAVVLDRYRMYESSDRFDYWKDSRKSQSLTHDESKALRSFVDARRSGGDPILKKYSFNNKETNIQKYFDHQKKVICFYSNIYWDIGLVKKGAYFDGVIEWLVQSIEKLLSDDPNNEKYNILIKVHPSEVIDPVKSNLGVEMILKNTLNASDFSRLKFVRPEHHVSPYDLGLNCDLNVLYNGTVGLEFLTLGLNNILVGGPAPYRYVVKQAQMSVEAYFEVLLFTKKVPLFNQDEAKLFSFFYLIGECVPWQYTTNSFGSSLFTYSPALLSRASKAHVSPIERWICEPS